jgi:hypothetical protein
MIRCSQATKGSTGRIQWAIFGFVAALALSATVGYAVQDFSLDEARTRIERLETRVSSLEATIAAGNGGTPEASEMHTITGTVVIPGSQHFAIEGRGPYDVGDPCFGDAGFDDIRSGASVRARDEAGNIVGLGRLNTGALVDIGTARGCEFSWTVKVEDASFYVFDVANCGGPSFTRAELEEAGWSVELSRRLA